MRASKAKQRRDIEELLVWAYRDELSKRFTSSAEGLWDHIHDYGEQGGVEVRSGGDAQRYDLGLPDPDAVLIESASGTLGPMFVDWDQSREALLGELAPLMASRDVLLLRSINTAALVVMYAKMAKRPDWHDEWPRAHFVPSPKDYSRPAIVGECRGRNRYTAGSYCPLRWEPSPITIALARAEYAVWHRGLCRLASELRLEKFDPQPPAAPAQPWLTGEAPRRILLVGERRA